MAKAAFDGIVRQIREGLFAADKGPAAGVIDVAIAAVAVLHGAVVLHYDSDYDHIDEVTEDSRHEWVVPRGTVL